MNKDKRFLRIVIFSVLILFSSGFSSFAQKGNLGIGVRLGDPTGFSLKKYMSGNKALEFSIGRAYYLWQNRGYYENGFYKISKYKDKNYYNYYGYKGYSSIGMQLHLMLQKPIADVKGLDVYYGIGPQFRYEKYDYGYYYKGSNVLYYDRYSEYDLGLDGVLGLEYTLADAPVSIFMDVDLFMEVVNDPFLPLFQAGLGVRYNLGATGGGGNTRSKQGTKKKK